MKFFNTKSHWCLCSMALKWVYLSPTWTLHGGRPIFHSFSCSWHGFNSRCKWSYDTFSPISPVLMLLLTFCLANPGSMTNTTPSIVSDVSAMLVDTTTFRPMAPFDLLGGAASKMRCWSWGGSVEYRGMHLISPISGPTLSDSRLIRLQASSISWGGNNIWKTGAIISTVQIYD